jgi:hypothetical protein
MASPFTRGTLCCTGSVIVLNYFCAVLTLLILLGARVLCRKTSPDGDVPVPLNASANYR